MPVTHGVAGSSPVHSALKTSKLASNEAFFISEKKNGVKNGVSFKEYRAMLMSKTRLPYKIPKIIRCKSGDWYIEYYYENPDIPGKWVPFKERCGINRYRGEEKESEAELLRKQVEKWLKEGHSPYDAEEVIEGQAVEWIKDKFEEIEKASVKYFTLQQACTKFMDYCKEKNFAERTITGYQSFVNNFTDWIVENKLADFEARKYTKKQAFEFLNVYYEQEDWSPRTFNNHVDFFQTLFGRVSKIEKEELLEKDIDVVYRMVIGKEDHKKDTAERNRAYTPQVADLVKRELELSGNENLNDFIQWIFHSCMRPKEIRLLKIQHINLQLRQVKAIGPTAKTGDRFVPIADELLELMNRRNLLKLNPNWYVFGNDGKPGPVNFNKNFFATRYLKIKRKLELDDNYTMYGWKHTAVILMILAGFTDEQIMERTGHRDKDAFKKYKRDLLLFNDVSPEQVNVMKGKTIDF